MGLYHSTASQFGSHGIILVVFSKENSGPGAIIERSPNGTTGWEEIAFLPSVTEDGNHYVDQLPNDGETRFYRAKHVWDQGDPGPNTNIVAGQPIFLDPQMDLASKPWPKRLPVFVQLDINTEGEPSLFVQGSFRSKSVRWATNVNASELPDPESGTVYNFNPATDPTGSLGETLGIATIPLTGSLSHGHLVRAGVQFFSEVDAEGRIVGEHYTLERYINPPVDDPEDPTLTVNNIAWTFGGSLRTEVTIDVTSTFNGDVESLRFQYEGATDITAPSGSNTINVTGPDTNVHRLQQSGGSVQVWDLDHDDPVVITVTAYNAPDAGGAAIASFTTIFGTPDQEGVGQKVFKGATLYAADAFVVADDLEIAVDGDGRPVFSVGLIETTSVPNLNTTKITAGRFGFPRLPTLASGQVYGRSAGSGDAQATDVTAFGLRADQVGGSTLAQRTFPSSDRYTFQRLAPFSLDDASTNTAPVAGVITSDSNPTGDYPEGTIWLKTGSFSSVENLGDLLDVNLTGVSVDDGIVWNGTQWVPGDVGGVGDHALGGSEHTDVSFTSLTDNQFIRRVSGSWTNVDLTFGMVGGTITNTQHGDRSGGSLHAVATTSVHGFMASGDKTKLNGIESGAQVNVGTNLGQGGSGNSRTITSSTGTNVTVSTATTSNAGYMSTGDKTKLDGIESGAQVNVATNLGIGTHTATAVQVTSSTGTNVTLPNASSTLAGLVTNGSQTFGGTKTFAARPSSGRYRATASSVGDPSFHSTTTCSVGTVNANVLQFVTSATERARIASGGQFLIGTTSTTGVGTNGLGVQGTSRFNGTVAFHNTVAFNNTDVRVDGELVAKVIISTSDATGSAPDGTLWCKVAS